MLSFSQMQSQFQLQMQSQRLALPPKPKVGPSATRVSTKESCVDPLGNDPDTGDSREMRVVRRRKSSPPDCPGRLYEGSIAIHNILLRNDQVKVGVEKVRDADAPILVPTQEVQLVG